MDNPNQYYRNHLEFFIQDEVFSRRGYGLHIRRRDRIDGTVTTARASNIIFEEIKEPWAAPPSLLTMEPNQAQQLMDELWRVGLRPTEGTGSAGAYAAQTAHLRDLQRLVFKEKK